MSELAKQLFEGLQGVKEAVAAVAPGLKDLVPEAGAELSRLGIQGRMELASALFNGNAFVAYGPGQYTPLPVHQESHEQQLGDEQQLGQEPQALERSRGR